MPYTYPPSSPVITGDTITINRFLSSPTLVAQRMRELLQLRYISDALLTSRLTAVGGAIQYESGEPLFAADNPRAVAPGAEYPLTTLGAGIASIVKTVKWGEDSEITDESISRQQMDPVNRGLVKLANQNVKYIDSVALAAVATAVTATQAAAATWATATAAQILGDVLNAKMAVTGLNEGFDPDTVVLDDARWGFALSKFATAGYMPRENDAANPMLTGSFPTILGMKWLRSPNLPTANTVLVLDSTQLGGMADEDIGGPGYVSASGPGTAAVQVKVMRQDLEDKWRIRARRVCVPVILEPGAARKITGV